MEPHMIENKYIRVCLFDTCGFHSCIFLVVSNDSILFNPTGIDSDTGNITAEYELYLLTDPGVPGSCS